MSGKKRITDKMRLDWMERKEATLLSSTDPISHENTYWVSTYWNGVWKARSPEGTIRSAIDSAMEHQGAKP